MTLNKTDVGLSNVDNTSDLNKPISNATNTALAAKVPTTRAVNVAGLASGGGPLTGDITINVSAASKAEAEAGTVGNKALTPAGFTQALAARQYPAVVVTPAFAPVFWFTANRIAADQPAFGSYVSSWQDIASTSATTNAAMTQATQANQPTFQLCEINRKPCVRFDGGDWLAKTNYSYSAPTGHTIIVVQRTPAPSNANFQFFLAGGDATWFGWQAGRVPTRSDASGATSNVSLNAPIFDKVSVVAYRVDATARQFWVGQTRVYSAAPTALPSTLQLSNLGSFNNTGYNLAGDLFEVLGFNVPLTDPQLAAIVAQLEMEWECEHEMLTLDGNSLFSGAAGGNGLHVLLRPALGRKYWVPNVAVSGNTTAQRRAAFAASVAPFLGPRLDGRKNPLLFTEFRNHLGASGVSYATAWSEFQAYIADATTAGGHAIATTMLASSGMPTNNWTETNRLQGNTDIRATWSGDRLFDWEALYQAGWIGSDGIHLNAGIGEPAVVSAFVSWLRSNSLYR